MRRILYACALSIIFSFAWFFPVNAAPVEYPQPAGFVTDYAGVIDDTTEARISTRLSALEATSTSEIAVAVVSTLEGLSIEEYAIGLFEYWGIGKAKQDNGVLLLVAPNEREVRIEVGYGLEGALTDIESSLIIDDILIPAFKENRYSEGIDEATIAIVQAVEGEYGASLSTSASDSGVVGGIMAVIIVGIFGFVGWTIFSRLFMEMSRSKSVVGGSIIGGLVGSFVGALTSSWILIGIVGAIIGGVIDWVISRAASFSRFRNKVEDIIRKEKNNKRPKGGGFGGFGGGGSSSSGGGFGGFGGGSSGGGGASGKW